MAQTNELNLGVSNASGLLNYTQPEDVNPLPSLGNLSTSQTVQGQLGNITATNDQGAYTNPLMTRATTRANQAANKRGLLNTSMANQAGQEAVLSAALPIAQADAKAYQTQGLSNQNAMNTFGTAAQAQGHKKALAEQAYAQQVGVGDYATLAAGTPEPVNYVGGGGILSAQGGQQRLTSGQQQAHEVARAKDVYQQQVGTGDYSDTQVLDSGGNVIEGGVGGGGLLQAKADIDSTARDQLYEQTVGTGNYAQLEEGVPEPDNYVGGGGTITAKNDALIKTQDDMQLHDTAMKGLDEDMRSNLLTLESNFNSLAQTSRSASTIYSSFLASLVAIQQDASLDGTAKTTLIDQTWGKAEDAIGVLLAFDSAALGVQQQVSDLQYTPPTPDSTV